MKTALLVILFVLTNVASGRADDWQRAEVYFIDWNVTTRVALTPARVRELAQTRYLFVNRAPDVAHMLALEKLKPVKDRSQEDARFVVDLVDDTMQRHTYYASTFHLCSADNRCKRPIDASFRLLLERLAKRHRL